MSAIVKMREYLESVNRDVVSLGDIINKCQELEAQEEKAHKAEAQASLVEDRKKIIEAIVPVMNRGYWEAGDMADAILSHYRPTPQSDILGELKSVLYAPCVFSESWKKVEKAKEIISKFEGGVK